MSLEYQYGPVAAVSWSISVEVFFYLVYVALASVAFTAWVVSKTRFGTLEFNEKDVLAFQGKPLDPSVQGGGAYLSEPYPMGAKDVVLVTKPGGTACPVKYYFVTVTKDGATATRSIGTCNEATSTERKGNSVRT